MPSLGRLVPPLLLTVDGAVVSGCENHFPATVIQEKEPLRYQAPQSKRHQSGNGRWDDRKRNYKLQACVAPLPSLISNNLSCELSCLCLYRHNCLVQIIMKPSKVTMTPGGHKS